MGKRSRQARVKAPDTTYEDPEHGTLVLRGALSPATRTEFAAIGGTREDAWQRQVEFLVERLARSWTVAGVAWERQDDLLARFRVATPDERFWMRGVLRRHIAENFPDVTAP